MGVTIRVMTNEQYESVIALWQQTEGIGLSSADSATSIARYLEHNPGLSLVAVEGETLVGAILCGHDGRRGYIHHLAIKASHRRLDIGRKLVGRALALLESEGIQKCHLFAFTDNQDAIAFWKRVGFTERKELSMMSKLISTESAT